MPAVNPEILVWARETAGLTQEEASKKLGFQSSGRSSAAQKLELLETGQKEPTRTQLSKMSEQYRRPLLTFYLSKPPVKADRGADFRTLSAEYSTREEAVLDALVREILARQSMVQALLEDDEEFTPLFFVGSRKIEDGVENVAESLRWLLGVELDAFRSRRTDKEAFDLLRGGAERAGVFVILQGNLGSHHTNISVQTFRGFSISNNYAPFIVINPHDARPALSFTLLHEMVHILLGQGGISSHSIENSTEQFCDRVAGAYLLLPQEIDSLALNDALDLDDISARISSFATERNLSRTMVAYNAYLANQISLRVYRQLQSGYRTEWVEERERLRENARDEQLRISPNVTRRYQIGQSLLGLVRRMVAAGELTTTKAAVVLGVKAGRVNSLIDSTG